MLLLDEPLDNYPTLMKYDEKLDFSPLSHMIKYINFEPRYKLVVYRFLYSDLFPDDCYREYHGKYGYSTRYYNKFTDSWKVVPSFIDGSTNDGFIIFDKLDEFEVVCRGVAYYAYSLEENYNPAKFLNNVKKIIPKRIEFVKKRYERDMKNLNLISSIIDNIERNYSIEGMVND